MKDEIEYNVISWIQPDAPNKKFYKEYHVAQTFQEALEKFDELKYKNSLCVNFNCEIYKAITKYERIEVL